MFDTDTAIPVTQTKSGPVVSNPFDATTARPLSPNEVVDTPKAVALEDVYKDTQDRRKSLDQMVAEGENYDKAVMKYLKGEPPTPISVMSDAANEFGKLMTGPVRALKALPVVAEWNFIAGLGRAMTPENITNPTALLTGALKNVGVGDPDITEPLIKSLDIKNPNAAALLSLLPSALQFETLTNGLGGKVLFGAPAEALNPAPLTVRENIAKSLLEDVQRARQDGLEGAKAFFQVNTPEKVYGDIKDLFDQGKLQLLDYPDVETAAKDLTQRIYSHWQSSLYQARVAGSAPQLRSAFKLLTGSESGFMYIPDSKALNIAKQIIAGEPAEFPAETLESILKASGSPITSAVVKIGEKTYTGATHEEALNKAGLSKGAMPESKKPIQGTFNMDDGVGRAFGKIEGQEARITQIEAGGKGRKYFEQVIQNLSDMGVDTLRVKIQSEDSKAVLKRLVEKGILSNPRDLAGISTNEYPTTFDIVKKPVEVAVEGKDYQALFRTDKGDITREEAKKEYGVERSTDLHKQAAQYIMDIASKIKQPIAHKTFTGIIKARGGMDFSKDYNVKEMKEFGLTNTPGAPTPDDWAATLIDEGLLVVPNDQNPGDYLMELLKSKGGRKTEELFSEGYYNRQNKQYLRDVVKDEELEFDVSKFEKESLAENERQINAMLKAAGRPSVMSQSAVKGIIREVSGQVSAGQLVSEESALKGRLKAEEQASKAGFGAGKAVGKEKEALRNAEMQLRDRARKEAAAEVKKLVNGIQNLNTKNLPLEYQDMIEAIKKQYDLSKRTQKTLARRESMKAFVERQREAGETINIPDELLDLLDKKSLNDMTLDDLREIHTTVMRLYKIGKLKDKLLTMQEDRRFADIVKEAVDTITKGKGLSADSTLVKALRKQDKSFAKMSLDSLQYFMKVNLRPEVMFNQMDDWNVRGICSKIWDLLEAADEQHSLDKDITIARLEQIFEGLSPKEIHKKYDVGRYKGITKDNMFKIYVHTFTPEGMNYIEGSGITEQDIKDITNFLSDKEKKMIDDWFDFADNSMWPRISEVREDIDGEHLAKVDHYFTIARTEGVQYDKELEQDILQARYARRPGMQKGFVEARTGVKGRGFADFSFFKDLSSHIDKVEHYIAFARAVRDARKFLYAPEIKSAISQKYGEDYYKILDKWLKDTAYGKLSRVDDWFNNVLSASRRQFAPALLSFNFLTTAKQILGYFPGMEYAGKSSTLMATAKYIVNPIKYTRMVKSKSVMMRYRNMRQEREFEELASKWGSLEKLGHLSGWNRVQKMGLWLTLAVDRVISTCVWGGSYDNSISKGMNEEDAVREANRVTRRTQPMGGLIHLPDLFRGPESTRQITFLRGHTNKFLNLQYEMIAKKKNGNSSNGKFISQVLFMCLIPAVGFFLIDKKRLPKDTKEWIGAVGRQATISLWLVENLFQWMATGYFTTDTPIESYEKAFAAMFLAKKPEKRAEKIAEFVGDVTGAPVVGVRRALKGQWFGAPEKKKKVDDIMNVHFGM